MQILIEDGLKSVTWEIHVKAFAISVFWRGIVAFSWLFWQGSNHEMERSPDWQCPNPACLNHTALVFGSKAFCPSCGSPKAGLESALRAAGQEKLLQQASPSAGGMFHFPSAGYGGSSAYGATLGGMRPSENAKNIGDWMCPNPNCVNSRNSVFGKHQSCPKCLCLNMWSFIFLVSFLRALFSGDFVWMTWPIIRCGMPKPTLGSTKPAALQSAAAAVTAATPSVAAAAKPSASAAASPASMMRYLQGPMGMSQGYGFDNYMAAALQSTLMASFGRPGDWQCPNMECVNHKRMVFAKHETCPQCGSGKPGKGGSNPQDWQCPNTECVNHRNLVFAKHASCPRCGSIRDAERPRSRSPLRWE